MAIDYHTLKNWHFADVEHSYTLRDTMLYALGVGCAADPTDPVELRFVYEENLQVLPTMAVVLGHPGFWIRDPGTGIDWRMVLHGEQGVRIHAPLPPSGTVIGRSRIAEIVDKGPGKGALIHLERGIFDKASGLHLATATATTFVRGEGGFGGPSRYGRAPQAAPDRDPDLVIDLSTSRRAALIYRLSGDDNPLHVDPAVARAAGFPRPILHGLCSFGIAGRAILAACCANGLAQIDEIEARFTSPVYPGETIRTEIWRDGAALAFRCSVVERNIVALSNGRAMLQVPG